MTNNLFIWFEGIAGKDALFCTLTDKIDAEVIERAGPSLKVIATMSVGYVLCKPIIIGIGQCKLFEQEISINKTLKLTLQLRTYRFGWM